MFVAENEYVSTHNKSCHTPLPKRHGTGRRIDHVIIENNLGKYSIETTSKTAYKNAQLLKEIRIRNNGGVFIRDRITGELIDFSNIPTRIIRVNPNVA